MKKILLSFVVILSLGIVASPALASASLFDGAKGEACKGAGIGADCDTGAATKTNSIIAKGLNLFSAIIGVIAVVMIMIAGIKYITSEGDSAKTAAAKNTVLYAAVGLVVVALAQIIVRFVLRKFTL